MRFPQKNIPIPQNKTNQPVKYYHNFISVKKYSKKGKKNNFPKPEICPICIEVIFIDGVTIKRSLNRVFRKSAMPCYQTVQYWIKGIKTSTTGLLEKGGNSVFTFSIHQEHNYPIKQKSNLDIGLGGFVGDEEYLNALRTHIPKIIEEFSPELIIYDAGADPYEEDQLGLLKLTKEGFLERDRFILECAKKHSVPVAVVLGGGYARDTNDVVDIHFQTIKLSKEIYS